MASVLTYCTRCRKEANSRFIGRDGLCGFCLTDEVIRPLKAEYRRLWAKRLRYLSAGIDVHNCEAQLAIVARRLGDKVHARINQPELAIGIINGHLEAIRTQVEHPALARIRLPRPGDLTRQLKTA